MAHPKRKISKTRRDKRRTHYKAEVPQLAKCPVTGLVHEYHRAYWDDDGNMFYKGQLVIEGSEAL